MKTEIKNSEFINALHFFLALIQIYCKLLTYTPEQEKHLRFESFSIQYINYYIKNIVRMEDSNSSQNWNINIWML